MLVQIPRRSAQASSTRRRKAVLGMITCCAVNGEPASPSRRSSRYPYRLSGDAISAVSRYLAVAEVAASLIEKHGADKRIGMKFRMNKKKYDAGVVALISRLFGSFELPPSEKLDEVYLMTRLRERRNAAASREAGFSRWPG